MSRRPKTFNDFIGQRRVIGLLARLIAGARELGRPCPPLRLTAPAGHGKTALGHAIAEEYGSEFLPLLAGTDTRAADVCDLLLTGQHGDVVLIDEAHTLRLDAQQILFAALDEEKIPAVTDKGRLKRSELRSIASLTIVLATNQPGHLKAALRSRLTPIEFDPYAIHELKMIAERVAEGEGLEITPQAARRLAEVAQGSPRIISRRVKALRLFGPGTEKFGLDQVTEVLTSEGVDARGLWPSQRLYLQTLDSSPRGVCSLERLAIKLGCDPVIIRHEVEPFLIERGWVEPWSGRGRMITAEGRSIVAEIASGDGEKTVFPGGIEAHPEC